MILAPKAISHFENEFKTSTRKWNPPWFLVNNAERLKENDGVKFPMFVCYEGIQLLHSTTQIIEKFKTEFQEDMKFRDGESILEFGILMSDGWYQTLKVTSEHLCNPNIMEWMSFLNGCEEKEKNERTFLKLTKSAKIIKIFQYKSDELSGTKHSENPQNLQTSEIIGQFSHFPQKKSKYFESLAWNTFEKRILGMGSIENNKTLAKGISFLES